MCLIYIDSINYLGTYGFVQTSNGNSFDYAYSINVPHGNSDVHCLEFDYTIIPNDNDADIVVSWNIGQVFEPIAELKVYSKDVWYHRQQSYITSLYDDYHVSKSIFSFI